MVAETSTCRGDEQPEFHRYPAENRTEYGVPDTILCSVVGLRFAIEKEAWTRDCRTHVSRPRWYCSATSSRSEIADYAIRATGCSVASRRRLQHRDTKRSRWVPNGGDAERCGLSRTDSVPCRVAEMTEEAIFLRRRISHYRAMSKLNLADKSRANIQRMLEEA
jgi:hypothetical protein